MRVALVDGFSFSLRGEVLPVPVCAQRLLAFVALQERPVARRRAAFALWPDATEAHAHGSLRTALFRLHVNCPGGVLSKRGSELELSASVGVDVRRARGLAALLQGFGAMNGAAAELEALLAGGELLPDWYDDWALLERARFHELRLHALDALCQSHLESGALARAVACARAAVETDPLRESSRRTLIRVCLVDGNAAEAVAQARQFTQLLGRHGLAPSGRFGELVHELAVR